jgi:hypothetical protein
MCVKITKYEGVNLIYILIETEHKIRNNNNKNTGWNKSIKYWLFFFNLTIYEKMFNIKVDWCIILHHLVFLVCSYLFFFRCYGNQLWFFK